jgi:hypothetical protein
VTEPTRVPLPASRCPLCGGPNGCAPAASGTFDTRCWCVDVQIAPEVLARLPDAARDAACLCRACATSAGR